MTVCPNKVSPDHSSIIKKTLTFCFLQYLVVRRFCEFLAETPEDGGLRNVLTKVCNLYSLWSLNKHAALLYEGKVWWVWSV